jgi:hypothetical protein
LNAAALVPAMLMPHEMHFCLLSCRLSLMSLSFVARFLTLTNCDFRRMPAQWTRFAVALLARRIAVSTRV